MDHRPLVHVIGAGVIGCTCAILLAETQRYEVIISGRDLPLDLESQAFASPWAGASFRSVAGDDERWQKWDTVTLKTFLKLMKDHPNLIMPVTCIEYVREPLSEDPWIRNLHEGFSRLAADELKHGFVDGYKYDSVTIRTPTYLAYLVKRLGDLNVPIHRRSFESIDECFQPPTGSDRAASIVLNCTGLGAKSLKGVEDQEVEPIKGQTVLIKGPPGYAKSITFGENYIIPRPGNETILGGCRKPNDWSLDTDFQLSRDIIEACVKMEPQLLQGHTSVDEIEIIRHNVGLRPGRTSGPRVEAELIQSVCDPKGQVRQGVLVHAYGISGSGYQSSWGIAEEVRQLVDTNAPRLQKASSAQT